MTESPYKTEQKVEKENKETERKAKEKSSKIKKNCLGNLSRKTIKKILKYMEKKAEADFSDDDAEEDI